MAVHDRTSDNESEHPRHPLWKDRDALIEQGFRERRPVLIDALPAVGKSFGTVKWAVETGNPLTVFTARHDLYDNYLDWSETLGADMERVKRLPAFHHDCPTARDEDNHGETWKRKVRARYNRGHTGPEIHNQAREFFGEELPCQQDEGCSYLIERQYDPDDYHILVGHYTHAYSWKPIKDRYVAFDEFPENDFLLKFEQGAVLNAITSHVSSDDSIPYQDATDLLENTSREAQQRILDNEFPKPGYLYERHTAASGFVSDFIKLLFRGKRLPNRWRYYDLGKGRVIVQRPRDQAVMILDPPVVARTYAQSVLALDGTPTIKKWQLLLGEDLQYSPVFKTDTEKREYLREQLGLRLVQTSTKLRPYGNRFGRSVKPDRDLALLEAIRDIEGKSPGLITSKKAREMYGDDRLAPIVGNVEKKVSNFGGFKGTNDLGPIRLGVIIGCPHPKDEIVEMWAALSGKSVEAATDENGERLHGMDTTFGSFGDQFLHGMRENEVLQAAMRFGREEDESGEKGATVYIHTAAIPEWVEPEQNIVRIITWDGNKDGMRKVIEAIKEDADYQTNEWRTDEIDQRIRARYSDKGEHLTIQRVRSCLATLENEYGYLASRRGKGRGRPKLWRNVKLETVENYGWVYLGPEAE